MSYSELPTTIPPPLVPPPRISTLSLLYPSLFGAATFFFFFCLDLDFLHFSFEVFPAPFLPLSAVLLRPQPMAPTPPWKCTMFPQLCHFGAHVNFFCFNAVPPSPFVHTGSRGCVGRSPEIVWSGLLLKLWRQLPSSTTLYIILNKRITQGFYGPTHSKHTLSVRVPSLFY